MEWLDILLMNNTPVSNIGLLVIHRACAMGVWHTLVKCGSGKQVALKDGDEVHSYFGFAVNVRLVHVVIL